MIKRLFEWVKTHKLTTALIVVIGYFLFQWFVNSGIYYSLGYQALGRGGGGAEYYGDFNAGVMPSAPSYSKSMAYESDSSGNVYDTVQNAQGLAVEVKNRMVTKNYNLSLVGKDIKIVAEKIASETEKLGGFVVSNSVSNYQDSESANLMVRVPAAKVKQFLASVRGYSAKVVSENENGSDITSEYTDVQENLRLLEATKVRFEEVWKASSKTQDMLATLREIQNLQREIDNLKGQEKYLKELSQYSLVTINLSKDELDLPYVPSESWNAEYVLRSAVRDLVRVFRGLATKAIWIVVFAVIWLPILLVAVLVYRKFKKQIVG